MRVLAFDTTGAFGSIALLEGNDLVEQVPLHSPDGFSAMLFDCVSGLLARRGLTLAGIDAFASASGPGSFTGVRVGLTAAKSLAEATGKPAVGVSNLQALASFGTGTVRAALIDARRGEVYAGLYDDVLRPLGEERVVAFPAWLASLPPEASCVVTPDFTAFRPHFRPEIPVIEERNLAEAIARIAAQRLLDGAETGDPAALDANYVRRSDAELKWKDEPAARK